MRLSGTPPKNMTQTKHKELCEGFKKYNLAFAFHPFSLLLRALYDVNPKGFLCLVLSEFTIKHGVEGCTD